MTRKEAIECGSKNYEGRPCKNCGNTCKSTSGRGCIPCHKKQIDVLRRTPKYRDKQKEYRHRPTVKAQINARNNLPEVIAARKAHNSLPEVKAASRNSKLKAAYGISQHDYRKMLWRQGGLCLGCDYRPPPGKHLHVDHNHKTGAIRWLLCSNCNTALGLLKDNLTILRNLINLLEIP